MTSIMNSKSLILIAVLFVITFNSNGQSIEPQLWFYSNSSPEIGSYRNDVEEIQALIKAGSESDYISEKQSLDMLYRYYEIQNTSVIKYSTVDFITLPFQCKDYTETSSYKVDFGADLIENKISEEFPLARFSFQLSFGSPVQQIDPHLFSEQVESIKLPASKELTYTSSPEIMTTNLLYIEGYDVLNYTSLISKDSTLIVAATNGKDSYQIPSMVKQIGQGALRGSQLKSITIPSTVVHIGERAFDQSSILSFYFMSTEVPSLDTLAFGEQLDKKVRIYVPKESIKAYKRAWKPLKRHIKAFPKSFDRSPISEDFDANCRYKICSGLQLTEDGKIINKNNRFFKHDFTSSLNDQETLLWKYFRYYNIDIDWMAETLCTFVDDYAYYEAYYYCKGVLKKWYDEGLICKSYSPFIY